MFLHMGCVGSCVDPNQMSYVDTARCEYGYVVAFSGPDLGCRI